MKSLIRIFCLLVLITGTGKAFADDIEDRHLSGFSGISVDGSFDVRITQGANESVKVEAPADIMDKIITEVRGGTLKVYNKRDFGSWKDWLGGNHRKIVVYVVAKNISEIAVSGSGDVYFKDGLSANNLRIRVSGSGDVSGRVDARNLECNISGSGDMHISGRAQTSNISVTGSGDFSGHDLITSSTSIQVTGSGDASVYANDRLNAVVTGSGDIRYSGSPKSISTAKSGSGDIHKD